MYGDEALVLVREAKRLHEGLFPVYNESAVRTVLKEMLVLVQEQAHLLERADRVSAFRARFVVHHVCIERNKRALLAYLVHRWSALRAALWDLAGACPPTLAARLSPLEARLAHAYTDLVAAYKGVYPSLDLASAPLPPKELFICVRVRRACGDIVTASGATLALHPDAQHFLRRTDVERLITQGYLEHLLD